MSISRSAVDCIKLINEEHILSGSQDGYVVVASSGLILWTHTSLWYQGGQ